MAILTLLVFFWAFATSSISAAPLDTSVNAVSAPSFFEIPDSLWMDYGGWFSTFKFTKMRYSCSVSQQQNILEAIWQGTPTPSMMSGNR
jgi:hypothetical protein